MIKEFKEFIAKGNVLDLAVGVIIGGAFGNIVTSFINNLIAPIIGCFTVGGFNELSVKIGKATLTYGAFIMDVINFLIMAFVIFLIVKAFNKVSKKKEEVAAPSADIVLLEEIRDLLKKNK